MITVVATRSGTLGTNATLNLYSFAQGATTATTLSVPSGVYATGYRPCFEFFRGALYLCGLSSRILRIQPNGQVYISGLRAPTAPTVLSASGTGLTNTSIGYLVLVQKDASGAVLQYSNPSAASNSLTLSNQGRAWTSPTTFTDSHATHIQGYVSVGGEAPGFAWERRVGDASSVTEQVTDAQIAVQLTLGNSVPVKTVDGETVVDGNARGVMPWASIMKIFHDRMWYVDPYKAGVYFSRLGEPGSVDEADFIATKDGEQPIGLGVYGDTLLVFCKRSTYGITGFGESDFRIEKLSSSFGCISHHSIVSIQGRLFFASETGICTYSGFFRNIMAESMRSDWISGYAANAAGYEDSQAVDDPSRKYRLLIDTGSGNRALEYVGDYTNMVERGSPEPKWSHWIRTRNDTCLGIMSTNGTLPPVAVTGSSDGYIRKPDATDDDDDGDTYAKMMLWRMRHEIFADHSGSLMHARNFKQLEVYAFNPNDDINVSVYVGDIDAMNAATPVTKTISAINDTDYVKQGKHLVPIHKSGTGITRQYSVTSPTEVEFFGDCIFFDPSGIENRPAR